jgi:hypothetical protein
MFNINFKKKNKLIPIVVILLIACLVLVILLFSKCGNEQPAQNLNPDDAAVTWNGEQEVSRPTVDNKPAIAVPGIKEMIFIANQKEQKVNLYNPRENNCYFQMNLYAEDELVWKSGNVSPGNGFYDIELTKTLPQGERQGYLIIKCYKQDGTELNSARVKFKLSVVPQ